MKQKTLENIRDFWRPVTAVIFALCLITVLILCLTGTIPCEDHGIADTVLWIMAGFLGVYSGGKSFENIKNKSLLPESPIRAGEGKPSPNL